MEPILFLPILIAMFLPLLLLFAQKRQQRAGVRRHLRRKQRDQAQHERGDAEEETEVTRMSNELIRSLIGKTCQISTGSLGEAFDKVRVVDVQDNWIRVEKKDKVRLINAEYVTTVKILDEA
jgi:hypothetical protein